MSERSITLSALYRSVRELPAGEQFVRLSQLRAVVLGDRWELRPGPLARQRPLDDLGGVLAPALLPLVIVVVPPLQLTEPRNRPSRPAVTCASIHAWAISWSTVRRESSFVWIPQRSTVPS